MNTIGWQHAKVKSTKRNPPQKSVPKCHNAKGYTFTGFIPRWIEQKKLLILGFGIFGIVHSRPKIWPFEN